MTAERRLSWGRKNEAPREGNVIIGPCWITTFATNTKVDVQLGQAEYAVERDGPTSLHGAHDVSLVPGLAAAARHERAKRAEINRSDQGELEKSKGRGSSQRVASDEGRGYGLACCSPGV